MNEFKHARDEYESTPIPEELDSRVRAGIRQGEMGSRTKRHGFRWGIGVAAACMVMVGGLNVSPTFAAAASEVPVLGEDWVNICNAAVQTYIDQDTTGLFFSADEGGFTTVDEATSFYLNEDGSVTLVFPEYTIAAGAAGIVEIPVAG